MQHLFFSKESLAKKLSKEKTEYENLLHELQPYKEKEQSMQLKIKEMQDRIELLNEEIKRSEQLKADLNVPLLKEKFSQKKKEYDNIVANQKKMEEIEAEKNERLNIVLSKLLEAKVDKKESEREIRMRTTIETMKRIFPNVHGRVIDLCSLSSKKYELAISIIFGKNADAVIVENEKTAIECIQVHSWIMLVFEGT